MSRAIRVEYRDAAYHVTARGNDRGEIFRDDDDRQLLLDTVGEACARFGLAVHAYCLMPNHYHLLVQTPRANLSAAVGWVQATYSIRFNRRHNRHGHLFQGRFKAHLIEADAYAAELIRYIHLNPVRPANKRRPIPVKRRADLERYRWSSHRAYAGRIGPKSMEPWLCLDWLSYFGSTKARARVGYRRQIAAMFGQAVESPLADLRGGLVLGGDALWQKALRLIEQFNSREQLSWRRRASADAVGKWVAKQVKREPDRRIQIWLLVALGGERLTAVAKTYGYSDASGAHRVVQRLEQSSAQDRPLARQLAAYRAQVSKVND